MLETVAALGVPYICMHMGGTEQQLHFRKPTDNITQTVFDFFIERMYTCKKAGIHDLIIDPGFGFGNSIAENFQLIRDLAIFKTLGRPILLGVSRKSSIYKTLGGSAETALNGSTVLHTAGLLKAAQILRVHDVKEAKEAVLLTSAIMKF
jgi:dihydropteroate synthase